MADETVKAYRWSSEDGRRDWFEIYCGSVTAVGRGGQTHGQDGRPRVCTPPTIGGIESHGRQIRSIMASHNDGGYKSMTIVAGDEQEHLTNLEMGRAECDINMTTYQL